MTESYHQDTKTLRGPDFEHLCDLRNLWMTFADLGALGGSIPDSGWPACMSFGFGYIGRVISDSVLKQAMRFHGHLGPWLVLGLKAGTHARKELAASPFELSARVFCPAGTPYTCFVDGVQFSSGCTMGKGNISHHRADGCRVEFTRTGYRNGIDHQDTKAQRGSDTKLRLALRPEVWDELHRRSGSGMADAAKLGREFARRRLSDLFTAGPTLATPGASR